MRPFYTIGHSTRPLDDFLCLIREASIRLIVDVRTVPRSRTNPQYNAESLQHELAEAGIRYEHIAALGGLRARQSDVAPTLNGFWQNRSFHNYADYALGEEFRIGLARLRLLGHATTCAIMCAEAVWWRCHRRIISDYLITAGETVFHIMGAGRADPARLTGNATPVRGAVTYPPSRSHEAKALH